MSNDLVFVLARVQFGSVTNTKFAQVRDAIQEQLREAYPFLDQRGDTTTFEVQFGPEGQKVNKVEIPSITLISLNGIGVLELLLVMSTCILIHM